VARILDQFGIEVPSATRWAGEMGVGKTGEPSEN
jgi:hypothetical protein